jgi:hypothetical protein
MKEKQATLLCCDMKSCACCFLNNSHRGKMIPTSILGFFKKKNTLNLILRLPLIEHACSQMNTSTLKEHPSLY